MTDPFPPLRLDAEQPVEIALAELEAQLDAFGRAFPFGTWMGDAEGRARRFSRSFLELVGMTVEEASGYGWTARLPPEDVERTIAARESALATGASWSQEFRIRDRHGAHHTILSRGVPIHGPDDTVIAWAGIHLDLTDRAEAESRLQAANERYEMVARATNDIIWDWDLQTGQVRWNEALRRIMGYDPEAIGDPVAWWTERLHPSDRTRVREGIEAAIDGGAERWSDEYRFRTAAGEWAVVLDRCYIARDDNGRPTRLIGSMLDVTARRAAERERTQLLERERKALEQAESAQADRAELMDQADATREREELERSRLRAILDVLPVGVWVADAEGRIVEGNAAGRAIWGEDARLSHRPEDYARDFQAWWPDGTPLTDETWALARAIRHGARSGPEELRIRTAAGEEKYILNYAVPILDDRGTIVGGVAVNVDLTEKKEAERLIARQLAEIESLYRGAPIGLCVLDEDLRFVRINDRLAEINGVPVEEHVGRTIWEVVPDVARVAAPRLRKVLETGEPVFGVEIEAETAARPGVQRSWVEHWIPLRDPDGKARAISIAAEEVTEQKAAEVALQRSERRQRVLAQAGELFNRPMNLEDRLEALARLATAELCDLCIIDLLGDEGTVHRAVVLHREEERQELAGELRQWAPGPESQSRIAHAMEQREALLVREVTDDVLRATLEDPRHLEVARELAPASALVAPLVARDRTFGAVTLFSMDPDARYDEQDLDLARDVAERAALSLDNARLYQEMEAAVRDREQVLAVVSHDLRNPLNTIGMASSLILEPDLPEEKRQLQARVIRSAFGQALRLIEDLLDVSRMQGGALTLERASESASDLVDTAVSMARSAADRKELGLEARASTERALHADRQRLLQVLDNLIGNAIQHTPQGGSVVVSAMDRGNRVRFEVSDTGAGIEADGLPHVFDRFWRGGGSSRSGAGLGLAIAKSIVESHGGEIGAESEPGKGSCFWFEIPVADAGA